MSDHITIYYTTSTTETLHTAKDQFVDDFIEFFEFFGNYEQDPQKTKAERTRWRVAEKQHEYKLKRIKRRKKKLWLL